MSYKKIGFGKGLIVIPAERIDEYKKLLVKYYEDDNEQEIKDFLLEYALQRIESNY